MEQSLLARMHQLRRRWRLVRALRSGLRWAAAGAWVGVVLALLLKLLDRPADELLLTLWSPLLFGVGGLIREGLSDLSLLNVALETDRIAGLKERLSTAVEWLAAARPATAVTQFMVHDAAEHAARVDAPRTFPWKLQRPLAHLVPPLGVAAFLLTTPAWGLWQPGPEPQEVRAVQASAQRIDQLARRVAEARRGGPRPLAPRLQQLAHQLQQKGVDRQEAATKIHSLARQLARERAAQGRGVNSGAQGSASQQAADRLGELARQLAQGQSPSALRQQLEALRPKLDPQSKAAAQAAQAAEALGEGDASKAREALEQAARSERAEGGEGGASNDLENEVGQELSNEGEELDPGSSPPSPGQAGQEVAANGAGDPSQGTKGKGPADFGVGSTNEEQKPGDGEKAKHRTLRQKDGQKSDWHEEYKRLYAARRDHFEAGTTRLKGQKQRGRVLRTQGEVLGAPMPGGDSQRAEVQVFLDSKQSAEQAVAQGSIPAEYRDAVRGYFDGIDPRAPK